MSGVVIKMCKFFRYFMEIAALDYLTAQNGKNHQVYDFIQIFSIEVPFFWRGGAHLYSVTCYLLLLSYCLTVMSDLATYKILGNFFDVLVHEFVSS